MAHTVKIQEIINGVQITETIDGNIVEKLISYQSKPFLRTTNEIAEETYQVLDIVGEIYNTPALATDFRIIDANDNVFIPANGVELIEYSLKIRAFRPDDDINEVLSVGAITTTSNSVTLGLHPSGTNAVRIDGLTYEKYYPDLFNFTPVTTGEKILIIHALPDAQVFHLVQGAESTEAVEPSYSGLFVARLLVTTEGIDIVEATSGFREKAVDNFAIYSLLAGDRVIGIGANMRLKVQSSGVIRIGGFYNEEGKVYNGCPISVRNDTPFPMEFYNAVDSSPEFMPINPDDLPFSIKPGETANFAYRGAGIVEIIKTGTTGDLTLEQARQNGNILEGDVEIRVPNDAVGGFLGVRDDVPALISSDNKHLISTNGFTRYYPDNSVLFLSVGFSDGGIDVLVEGAIAEEIKGIVGSKEFNKQGDRKAFAQLSDVYDYYQLAEDAITTEKNRNDTQDGQITDMQISNIIITTTLSITTNTVGSISGKGQHGRNVRIDNGVNAINLSCESTSNADFIASYTHWGTADITFTSGSGITVNDMTGTSKVLKAGGSATLERYGNVYRLRISNP